MGGKASIYMVLGFSLIFLVASMNYGRLTINAVDNNVDYYKKTVAHNIAVTGANMAANEIFMDNTWVKGYSNLSFSGGTIKVTVADIGSKKKKITSTGTFGGIERDVSIILQPSGFTKYAYYTNIFPGNKYLNTGDTITGPFHTQGKLNVKGSPVFQGKASAKNGLKLSGSATPKFYGGFQSGVDVPLNWSTDGVKTAAQTGGYVFNAGGAGKVEVKLTFKEDATLTYSKRYDSGSWSKDTTVTLSTFAPNGIIYVEKGNVYMEKSVINGAYSVVVDQSSGMGTGNVYIDDDVRYKTDPSKYPTSKDMLGIIASNNVLISDTPANEKNVNIDATIFAYKGGLGLVNESMPFSGTLKVFGGVIEYQGRTTGTQSGSTITNGYRERIVWDDRLMLNNPPYFPATDKYEVVSWLE